MLSIDYIRENKQKVIDSAKNKGYKIKSALIDGILKLGDQQKKLIQEIQVINEERNSLAKQKPTEEVKQKGKELKGKLKTKEEELRKIENDLNKNLFEIPNPPADDVKVGKDESANEEIKKVGEPQKFNFKVNDHIQLGQSLDLIDIEAAAKVSGSRFAYLKNEAVLLEFALVNLALEILTKEGFTPVVPPVLVKKEVTDLLGYWQGGGNEDYYWVHEPLEGQGLYLVGTAEHSLVPIHQGEIFGKKDLPKRYVGFSTSFRREAGSYGKDVRGIFRVHQFDKVEMISYVAPEDDQKEHEFLLSLEEKLFQALEVPYRIMKMCAGELGFPIAKKYDLEVWIPSQNKYRELTSVSTTTDFQSRRLNIKYRDNGQKKYVHILNGTAFAIGRTLITILENHQQADGSVKIPKALQKYTGFDVIKPK